MSNGNKESNFLAIIMVLIILVMTGMSVYIFVLSSNLQDSRKNYTLFSERYSTFADLLDSDIQAILQEDGAKYEISYSYLQDLAILNNLYSSMLQYNQSHPGNYTQQDFDQVAMDFASILSQLSFTIESTWVFQYSNNSIGATLANNFTHGSMEWFLISNHWDSGSYAIHDDIKSYVLTRFAQTGDTVQLLEIRMDKWIENLYRNISILSFTNYQSAISYSDSIGNLPSLVNTTVLEMTVIAERYFLLIDKTVSVSEDFNNTLITLATSAVILAFALSFSSKKYQRIILIIGLIVLFLAVIYLGTSLSQMGNLVDAESRIFDVLGQV